MSSHGMPFLDIRSIQWLTHCLIQTFDHLLRNPNFNLQQQQQQQQMQHAHQQQPFGLPGPMNGMQGGPAMHDPAARNFQFNQFGSGGKVPMLQALARNPSMLQHAIPNSQDFSRQLNLLNLAQAHQQPNQPPNASSAAALRQLQQQRHLSMGVGNQMASGINQNSFFPSSGMPQGSDALSSLLPHSMSNQQPPMQPGLPINQGQGVGPPIPQHALRDKLIQVQQQIKEAENQERLLSNSRTTKNEVQFHNEMAQLQRSINDKKMMAQKLATMVRMQQQQAM